MRAIVLALFATLAVGLSAYGTCDVAAETSRAAVLHVAPQGRDDAPGTSARPLRSLTEALRRVRQGDEPTEIVLSAGTYGGDIEIEAPAAASKRHPELTIRAARDASGSWQEVVLEGGAPLEGARAVEGTQGVYRAEVAGIPFDQEPQVWERDSRVRYLLAADRAAVRRHPASYWYSPSEAGTRGRTTVYFHTSDGRPPSEHEIFRSQGRRGFAVHRSDVTLRGLNFRGFLAGRHAAGVVSRSPRTRVEDCHVRNSTRGFAFGRGADGGVLKDCSAVDVGGGVYVQADDVTVERCRLLRSDDAFRVPIHPQDDSGIQYYFPASGGTARENRVVGFRNGLFIKRRPSSFVAEANTFLHPAGTGWRGMGPNRWHPQSRFQRNVVAGFRHPVWKPERAPAGALAENCVEPPGPAVRSPSPRGITLARPVFVDPEHADLRLVSGSACAGLGAPGRRAGAAGVAPAEVAAAGLPPLEVSLEAPARLALASTDKPRGTASSARGGGSAPAASPLWLSPERDITVRVEAEGTPDRLRSLQLRAEGSEWRAAAGGSGAHSLALPPSEAPVAVSLRARDARGEWHVLEVARVLAGPEGPRVLEGPHLRASDHGLLATVHADRPVSLRLEHGATPGLGASQAARAEDGRRAGASRWMGSVALGPPRVASGARLHWRLVLRDALGRETEAGRGTAALAGAARALHVAPDGRDAADRGAASEPLASLQYAAERALPGDRIVLAAGLHTEPALLRRGGLEGVPLRIEAAGPGAAVLDGGRAAGPMLRLEGASHVVVEGLEIRWFEQAGIELEGASDVTLRGNRIWNDFWFGFVSGPGIRAERSPGLTVERNVIYRTAPAMRLLKSPRARILHNTTAANMGGAFHLFESVAGTVLWNNSFAFEGMQAFRLKVESPQDLKSFESDWNNLGLHYRKPLGFERAAIRSERRQVEAKDRALGRQTAKYLVRLEGVPLASLPGVQSSPGKWRIHSASRRDLRMYSLEDWRGASGHDRHSITADPEYVDPESGDFRLAPGSPNVGAGRNGETIGALGVAR